ncbi:MAG: Stk1 family PASTA domain-containing Ser/Thr kinase [Acidobacteriota bacterium]|nr:Stk1 family PASTA domain-containing Ser/Thr kinase [Acidobacteriota bacterium]
MSQARPGMVIANRYRLDVLIGEGGMSTVWRGTDLSLARDVAIKVLREEIAGQADAVSRFRREAHAAAKLNHPNIVQIYDTGMDGDIHFIVMEYLPEPDLKKVIKGWAPLPEERGVAVAIECCRALAYAHRNGIVHRDVKPHNILFTDEGRVKLSDFGIAAALGAPGADSDGFVLGSAHYISPEQVQGSPAGPHSDLYSLGCVLYEALTARTPFNGASEAEIASRRLRERATPIRTLNPAISPAVEFIINKAMARDVAQRYRSADEMLADLVKLSGGGEFERTGVLVSPDAATTRLEPDLSISPSGGRSGNIRERFAAESGDDEAPTVRPPRGAPVVRPQQAKPAPIGPMIAIGVVAALVLLLVVWLLKLAFYSGDAGPKVQVPMVKGKVRAEARAILEANHLVEGVVTTEEDPMQPEGVVIHQSPPEGSTVEAGTPVDLVVNRGTEMVVTVSVEGRTLEDANEVLERAGLSLGEVSYIYHATVPVGIVVKQSIKPGAKVERRTEINLTVSKGPEPQTTVEPPPGNQSGAATVVEPEVQLTQDTNYVPSTPGERRWQVTVTVQGRQLGQDIQVVKQDDSGARVVVLSEKLNPSETYKVPVVTEGAAIIEVIHNGRVVFRQEEPAPAGSSGAGDMPTGGDSLSGE